MDEKEVITSKTGTIAVREVYSGSGPSKCENCLKLEEENKVLVEEATALRDTLYSIWDHTLEATKQYDFND